MRRGFALLLTLTILGTPARAVGQTFDEAMAHIQAGRYEEAEEILRALSRGLDSPNQVKRTTARVLLEVGRHEEARETVEGQGGEASSLELETVFGESLYAVGRVQEAEAAFRRAVDGGATDRHLARMRLGILLWDRGEREPALDLFDSFIDLYNGSSGRLTAEDLMAVAVAVRYLGVRDPQLHKDAVMAAEEAAEADPDDLRPILLTGELFLEGYKATEARVSFGQVLERNPRHPRALLGQAKVLDLEGTGGAIQLVNQALEVNPNYAEARAVLAGLHLKTANFTQAREEARKALAVNPVNLEALSVLAATHFLSGDMAAYHEAVSDIHALNPLYASVYTVVAEQAVNQRLYQTAVDLAQQAVDLDPTSWWSYGVLGMNQLRTGDIEEGRANLEAAWSGDPYNPWYMNTLDLLDTFVHYETISTDHFELVIHEREAELLGPYAAVEAEKAYSALRDRYGIEPPTPIRVEIFPSHSDFSVRTLGIPGLGALGVSFGSILVMDSPSAQDPGYFNWISTMWHEVAHAFHLAMSEHRVPRWFTEGLAVHEQHMAQRNWGHRPSPGWLRAYDADRLRPVSRLEQGFLRPTFPEEVVFSYYQGSLVFEFIEARWGLEAILAMLRGFSQGKTGAQLFDEVLGQDITDFDQEFDDYVQQQWGDRMRAVASQEDGEGVSIFGSGQNGLEALHALVLENPGSFPARLAYGQALFREDRLLEAEGEFRAAASLFPEYGGGDSPYFFLAQIHKEQGDAERAASALHLLGALNETLLPVHLEEADLWLELGDLPAAAEALRRAVEIAPFDVEPHQSLAGLYAELGEVDGEVLERRAILALDPVDKAEAHYQLAEALKDAGERTEAKTQVLRALEIAPTYGAALELLLELRREIP